MGKIAQETIEQIAAANDIVEVIGSYFPLKRAGSTFKAICPFHQEKSPSFTVNPQRQIFKCFGCGAGGSVFRFVMDYEHVDFVTAVRRLADRAGIRIIEEQLSTEDDQRFRMRKRLLALHQEATEWFHRNLLKTPSAQVARDYLKGRGITAEVAKAWKIGYAPESWDALGKWAQTQGYSVEELVRSGLVKVHDADDSANDSADDKAPAESQSAIRNSKFYDRFRNRVMFPICNDLGEVIAFSGRVLESGAASGAKYVNSPETMLFTKGNVLFGLHKSKRALIEKNSAIVCEGQLDLITAFEAGVKNVIAPQGTAFTDKQARILKRYVEEVVLCFDADAAGQKAAERSLASLLDASLFVRVAQMPDGHDPDSLIRELGAEAFVAQINHAKDFFDFQIDRHARSPDFATPRGRLRFAKKMAESVSLVADPVMRDAVINNVCARLEIPAGDFRAMLAAPRREELGDGKPAAAPTAPKLSNTVSLLCRIALSDSGARAWLLSQPWPELLGNNPECDLLAKILGAPLTPEEPTSLAAFMSGLHGEEEAIVSALLSQKPLYNPEIIAADCWREFERGEIQRRREAATSRMRAPGLPFGELLALQREVMDLQKRLDSLSKTDRSAVKRNP